MRHEPASENRVTSAWFCECGPRLGLTKTGNTCQAFYRETEAHSGSRAHPHAVAKLGPELHLFLVYGAGLQATLSLTSYSSLVFPRDSNSTPTPIPLPET